MDGHSVYKVPSLDTMYILMEQPLTNMVIIDFFLVLNITFSTVVFFMTSCFYLMEEARLEGENQ